LRLVFQNNILKDNEYHVISFGKKTDRSKLKKPIHIETAFNIYHEIPAMLRQAQHEPRNDTKDQI